MIDIFDEDDYLDWNYDFFRTHRLIPALRSRALKRPFRLRDLQAASLRNHPAFVFSIYARLLAQMYDSLWIAVPPPTQMLTSPGEQTLHDLAVYCHQHSSRIAPPIA